MVYTVLVADGGMPLETAVDLVAGHPVAIFGPALRKGSLVPGGDANVVLYDPAPRTPLDERTLHPRARCSLWPGVALQGRVLRTISREVTVYRDGTMTGTPSHGRFVLCAPFDRERVEQALCPTRRGV
jgi:dihydropyrimidinase